jgi:tetratricopeptide (TPR) repeat protein
MVVKDPFILARLESSLATAPPLYRAFAYRYAGLYDSYFYNKAIEQAQKVLEEDPKNLDGLLTVATAYHRLGKVKESLDYTENARQLYPNNPEPWARLAGLDVHDRDPNNTLQLMIKAVQLDPRNSGNLYNLGWMFEQVGDVPKAIGLYEQAIQASPVSFEAMNNLALIYEQNGQTERAIGLLARTIAVDPELEEGYYNMANHYVRQREWKMALAAYNRALEINPASAAAAVEKGRIHIEIGDAEAAVEDLNRALEFDAHSFDAYYLLATAYEKMNHLKEATAAADEAQRIRPGSPDVKTILDRLHSS